MTHLTASSTDDEILAFLNDPCAFYDRAWGECPNTQPCDDHGVREGRWP